LWQLILLPARNASAVGGHFNFARYGFRNAFIKN
jgi:hypothetical protein